MRIEQYLKLGKQIAIISFLCGTIIFGVYFLTSSFIILFVGYGFTAIAGLINIVVLVLIITKTTKENKKKLSTTCILMLLNIPVMIFYSLVIIILLNTMRITFKNLTKVELTNIKITGCEPNKIDILLPKQSKTVWINITGDCTINIEYIVDGQRKEENVVAYLTSSMGQKMQYNIGGKNEQQF